MPSLRDQLNQNRRLVKGPQGLQLASQETVQQMATAQGIAPPLTPAGAGAIGANPDQAKMVGTPAQKAPALNLAQQAPGETLRGAQQAQERQVAAGAAGGAAEAQTKEKSEQLQAMQGLGDRVQDVINQAGAGLTSQMQGLVAKTQFGPEVAIQGGTTPEQLSTALNLISTAGGNQAQAFQGLTTVNQALGKSPDAPINPEDLKNLYQNVDQSIIDNIVKQMPDKILVSPEMAASLGYQDSAQLEGLLGIPAGQLATMSVQQLQDQVETAQAAQFDKVASLREKANDPNLSSAERQSIATELRSMGATGLRASEEQVADTLEQVNTADQVEFGGKTYALEELLADDKLSGVIGAALEDPEGKLMKSLPQGLQDFITNNRAVLADATEGMDLDTQEFGTLQADNLAVDEVGVGPEMDQSVTSLIFGEGWDQEFRGGNILDEIDEATGKPISEAYPGFALLKGDTFDDTAKTDIVGSLNALAEFDPGLAKQVLQLSAAELQDLGIANNSPEWQQFMHLQKQARELKNVDSNNLDAVLDTFLGRDVDANELSNSWREAWAMKSFGMGEVPGYGDLEGLLGNDGKLTSQSLYDKLSAAGGVTDLRKYKSSIPGGIDKLNPDALGANLADARSRAPLFNKIKGALMDDGNLDAGEARQLRENMSYEELADLTNNPHVKGNDSVRTPLRNQMVQILNNTAASSMKLAMSSAGIDMDELMETKVGDTGIVGALVIPGPNAARQKLKDNWEDIVYSINRNRKIPDWARKETIARLKRIRDDKADWGGATISSTGISKAPGMAEEAVTTYAKPLTTQYNTQNTFAKSFI